MNAFKIAWKLFKNNLNLYRFYVSVLGLTAAVCYNFLSVSLNPYLGVLNEQYVYAQTASVLGSIVLFITVIYLMFHANCFFYQLHYKEIGIYMLAGVAESRIGAVFALESVFTGISAMLIGIPVGILFSKLFFMLLGRAMILSVSIPFYISIKPVLLLIIIFFLIILAMGLMNYRKVKHSRLISILNAAKEEQRPPKLKYVRGAISLLVIGSAYYLILNISSMPDFWPLSFLRTATLSLLLICGGTYLFFGSFLGIVFDRLIRNKKIIYRKTRLVSFSNTLFRLKTNYSSLSMTAILCAASLTAFSGSLALRYFADTNTLIEAPFSIMFLDQSKEVNRRIYDIIEDSEHRITHIHESRFLTASLSSSENCLITSLSEAQLVLDSIETGNREVLRNKRFLKEARLSDSETIRILHSNLILSAETQSLDRLTLNGREFSLISTIRAPFSGSLEAVAGLDVYIVSDDSYRQFADETSPEHILYGINISDQQSSIELVSKIDSVMKNPRDNLNSFAGQYRYKYYLIGAFYFIGLIMAIVFIISSFSTMYFKLLSDAVHDKEQYEILLKTGMTRTQVRHSIFTQMGLSFVPAVIIGLIHGAMAMKVLESLIQYRFTGCLLIGINLLLIVMTAFYFVISSRYVNLVLKESNNETNL